MTRTKSVNVPGIELKVYVETPLPNVVLAIGSYVAAITAPLSQSHRHRSRLDPVERKSGMFSPIAVPVPQRDIRDSIRAVPQDR